MTRRTGEYARLVDAQALARAGTASAAELLEAMAGLVDLLGRPVLTTDAPDRLDTDAVALLAFIDEQEVFRVCAATRDGGVVLLQPAVEAPVSGPAWRTERRMNIEDFRPARDRVIGLYATRRASAFRNKLDVVIVVRRGAALRVHALPAMDDPASTAPLVGDATPPWMRVCPVTAKPGVDLLAERIRSVPPSDATGALYLGPDRALVSTGHVTAFSDGNHREGESITWLDGGVAVVTGNQAVDLWLASEADRGRTPRWTWHLPLEPVSICPLPLIDGRPRLLVACEAGTWLSGVLVGAEATTRTWRDLGELFARSAGLMSLHTWVDWAERKMVRREVLDHQQNAAVILRLLLERGLAEDAVEPALLDRLVAQFAMPVDTETYWPAMYLVRERASTWEREGTARGASLIQAIYRQVPFEVQDLFNFELRHLRNGAAPSIVDRPSLRPPQDDSEALAYLAEHAHVSRHALLQKTTDPGKRAILHAQAWMDSFILEEATTQPHADDAEAVTTGLGAKLDVALQRRARAQLTPTPDVAAALAREQDRPRFVVAAEAGDDVFVIVERSGGQTEIRLWSGTPGAFVARAAVAAQPHRAIIALRVGPDRWLVVMDRADDAVSAFSVDWSQGSADLALGEILSRRLPGRVRCLSAIRLDAELEARWQVVVGTADGAVLALDLRGEPDKLEIAWMYRSDGAIRDLATRCDGVGGEHAALSAPGEVVVLDERGRRVWSLHLRRGLRRAAFFEAGAIFLGVVDAHGVARIYRRTDRTRSREVAIEEALRTAAWNTDIGTAVSERLGTARALALLAARGEVPVTLPRTRDARAWLVRGLAEHLGHEAFRDGTFARMTVLTPQLRLRELRTLAGVVAAVGVPPDRRTLTRVIVDEIAGRLADADELAEEGKDKLRRAAGDVLAEVLRGIGEGFVNADWLASEHPLIWRELVATARPDTWVLLSLCMAGERTGAALFSRAMHLGPQALVVLPMLVDLRETGWAEALHRAARTLPELSERLALDLLEPLRAPDLPAGARVFCRALRFACMATPTWEDLLALCAPEIASPTHAYPAVRFMNRVLTLCATLTASLHLPLDDQREALESTLRAHNQPGEGPPLGAWADWLEVWATRFRTAVATVLEARERTLADATRAFLAGVRVQPIADGLVGIHLDVLRDGVPREDVRATIEVPQVGGGLRALDAALHARITLTEEPVVVDWVGVVEQDADRILVEVTTEPSGGPAYRETWTIPAPRSIASSPAGPLDELAEVRRAVALPLRSIRDGFHILALDHGMRSVAQELLREGVLLVDLDSAMASEGPGRTNPRGFTARAILAAFKARLVDDGPTEPARPTHPVIVWPATETTRRLLGGHLRHVLEELRAMLPRILAAPVFWMLPVREAGELQGALDGLARYHDLHRVPLAEGATEELHHWLTRSGAKPERAREAVATFGRHLRLLQCWLGETSEGPTSTPREFLIKSEHAAGVIEADLSGLGVQDRAHLILATAGQVKVPGKLLKEGMRCARPFPDERNSLVAAGQVLRSKDIATARTRMVGDTFVSGFRAGTSDTLVPEPLEPLARAIRLDPALEKRAYHRLADRGLLSLTSEPEVAAPCAPYAVWLEARLAEDPSGIRFVEGTTGKSLFEALSFDELARVGDAISRLCPEIGDHSWGVVKWLGELAKPEPIGGAPLEKLGHALTGCPSRSVGASADADAAALLRDIRTTLGNERIQLARVQRQDAHHVHYLAYLAPGPIQPAHRLRDVVDRHKNVVVSLLGPGLRGAQFEESERICVLTDPVLKEVLGTGSPPAGFWKAVRNRVGLMPFSPFQVGNQLPVGSPVFVGREEETHHILASLDKHSFLILGGRQIGKTSLLRHLYGLVKGSGRKRAIWLDAAGLSTLAELLPQLRAEIGLGVESAGEMTGVEAVLRGLEGPVLFINEADGLCQHDPTFLWRLRALSEQQVCQSVLVGYQRAHIATTDATQPFFHWTRGRVGDKAYILGALGATAAHQLIQRLEQEPLSLEWENDDTKAYGYRKLAERSHGIPILLQHACQRLVERLHTERRWKIRWADVDAALRGEASPAWEYIQTTKLLHTDDFKRRNPTAPELAATLWADLVLGVLVAHHYFSGATPPIANPKLREQASAPLAFTPMEALRLLRKTSAFSALVKDELERFEAVFPPDEYQRLLDSLSLTVLVAPVVGGDRQYHFPGHVYPIELHGYLERTGTIIDDYLYKKLADINELLAEPPSDDRRDPHANRCQ